MASSGHQGNIKHPEKDGRLKENREAGRTMGTTPGSRERQETGGHSKAEEQHSKGEQRHTSKADEHRSSGDEHRSGKGDERHASKGDEHRSGKGDERHASKGDEHRSGGGDDMKSREYKDAEGNVHHHTHTYMEQHNEKK